MKRLPPLSAIEAFVEAARRGSVKEAAEALALSSPALTRRIQNLERHVGRPLFVRRPQSIRLNSDGERLLGAVAPALESIQSAIERTSGADDRMRLRLSALPLFASYHLMPRLGRLRELHPELHVEIETLPGGMSRLGDGIDAAIILARDVDPMLHSRRLGTSRVVAIGSRALQEGPDALTDPAQISRSTVLLHRDLPDAFIHWRDEVGQKGIEPAAIDLFDSGQLILDAAAQGLGIAFMFEMHLERAGDPRLTRLFDLTVESPYSYWFVCHRAALERPVVRIFHDWLLAELG